MLDWMAINGRSSIHNWWIFQWQTSKKKDVAAVDLFVPRTWSKWPIFSSTDFDVNRQCAKRDPPLWRKKPWRRARREKQMLHDAPGDGLIRKKPFEPPRSIDTQIGRASADHSWSGGSRFRFIESDFGPLKKYISIVFSWNRDCHFICVSISLIRA